MTKNLNLIENQDGVNESNFLDYGILSLKKLNSSPEFHAALERLDDIRSVLQVARAINKLTNIGNRTTYMEALRWMRGEVSLNNFVFVQQITEIKTAPDQIFAQFNQYTQQLLTSLQSEAIYGQIEIALKIAPAVKAAPVTKQIASAGNEAEKAISDTAQLKSQELDQKTIDADQQLRNLTNELQQNFAAQISNERQNATNEIRETLNQATRSLRTAESLNDWGARYDADIKELEYKLLGINTKGVVARNYETIVRKVTNTRRYGLRRVNWGKMITRILYLVLKNIISVASYTWSKLMSYAGRRTVLFFALSTLAVSMVIFPLLSKLDVVHIDIFTASDFSGWLAKVSIWIPAVVILSIGYSFTTKNYRIYSNMLDQYKHRRAVARTAQGIILGANGSEEGKELRAAMTAAAASALFEHKVTGHLSKKEVESFGLFDVIRSIGGK